MKTELPYFRIGSSYGGNQDWFYDAWMKLGGCAAETACECCIYLDLYFSTSLYPFDIKNLNKKDYIAFAMKMKPYLHPRFSGIDRLDIYTEGFGKYLENNNSSIRLAGVEGSTDYETAKEILKAQLDRGIVVPYLHLNHKDRRFREYDWHWFIINGYEEFEDSLMVKAVTYSSWEWLDFNELWHSGYKKKGGFIIIDP